MCINNPFIVIYYLSFSTNVSVNIDNNIKACVTLGFVIHRAVSHLELNLIV